MIKKVLVVGLDGASLDLIEPWTKEGLLPGFARLMREGAYGPLESVPNMRSAAAWSSFITGRNPGKHGIFEFYDFVPGTYDVKFINAGARDGRSFWKVASDAEKNVGIINVPMTYPAEEVNGFLLAGLDAPGTKSKGFAYPEGFLEEIERTSGEYIIEPGISGCIVDGKIEKAKKILLEEIDLKVKVSRHLMDAYPWDLFVTVFRSTDAAHHCFWKFIDPGHAQYCEEEAKQFGDVILTAYQGIDSFLQETLNSLGTEALVLLVSDHGCGPKHPASGQLN